MSQAMKNNRFGGPCTTNTATVTTFVVPFVALNPPQPIEVDRRVPNDETAKVIKDSLAGKNVVRCESADDMFRKLGI